MYFFPGNIYYAALMALAVINCICIVFKNIEIVPSSFTVFIPVFEVFCLTIAARFIRNEILHLTDSYKRKAGTAILDKIIVVLDSTLFTGIMILVLPVYSHILMNTNIRYFDSDLNNIDNILHLGWKEYLYFVSRHPFIIWIFYYAYSALGNLAFIVLLIVLVLGRPLRGEFYSGGFLISAVLCITVGMFMPAKGAVFFLMNGHLPFESWFDQTPGMEAVPSMDMLKSGNPQVWDLARLPGLVTFPSFHTAAGVVFAWSLYRTIFFWPACLYMITMIASTPIFGSHYFIDIIGGLIVAAITMLTLLSLPKYRNVFDPSQEKLTFGHMKHSLTKYAAKCRTHLRQVR